jgi:uncharacterized protein YggE
MIKCNYMIHIQSNNNSTKFLNFTLIAAISTILVIYGLIVVVALLSNSNNTASAQQSSSVNPFAQTNNTSIINNIHTLFTTGIASSKVKTDKVIVSLGVQTTNNTASAALVTNSEKLNKVINKLKAAGVKGNETSTSSFSIFPNYNYSQSPSATGKITGFTVSNSIQIESSNINNISKWIDTAVAAGSNNVNNVDFALSDKRVEETKNNLIEQAINNAKTKADIAASALGLKILVVKSISLNEFNTHPPEPFLAKESLATGTSPINAATPIISGKEQVSISVSMVTIAGPA